jgi:hypothetical protein
MARKERANEYRAADKDDIKGAIEVIATFVYAKVTATRAAVCTTNSRAVALQGYAAGGRGSLVAR